MIARIEGTIVDKTPTRVVVLVQGIGYEIHIPVSTYEALGRVNDRASLETYLHVREDCLQLYGFSTMAQKSMFLQLLSVSGIGPKLAIGILSGSRVEDLAHNIVNGNVDLLTRIPGLGKKTAQRLIMELQEKVSAQGSQVDAWVVNMTAKGGAQSEAVLALVSLGVNRATAEREVAKILSQSPDASVDEIIKKVLQNA